MHSLAHFFARTILNFLLIFLKVVSLFSKIQYLVTVVVMGVVVVEVALVVEVVVLVVVAEKKRYIICSIASQCS